MDHVRILLLDDHPALRHGIRQLIDSEPDLQVCAEATNREELLEQLNEVTPDMAIVDITLQDKNTTGLDLIGDIHAKAGQIPVLVFSMHDETLYAERAMAAGARGYLMKQEPVMLLLDAIRAVMRGEIYLSKRMNQALLQAHVKGGAPTHPDDPVSALSVREFEILRMLGKGMPPREIAEAMSLSVRTVETHRRNMRNKLGCGTASELTQFAVDWVHREA